MENSKLNIYKSPNGTAIFYYNNIQVDFCSVVRLIEKDKEGNWTKFEEIGTTLASYPDFRNLRRTDAFDGTSEYVCLYRQLGSSSLVCPIQKKKFRKAETGTIGVIPYHYLHSKEFEDRVFNSNYNEVENDAEKMFILNQIASQIEEERIKEEISKRTSKQENKKPRQRV